MPANTPDTSGSPPNQRSQSIFYNWISIASIALVTIGILGGFVVVFVSWLLGDKGGYVGILFLPLIAMIVIGVITYPVGLLLAKRQRARGQIWFLPSQVTVDFHNPTHRYVLVMLGLLGLLALPVVIAGSVESFQVTESNEFCGQLCHSVMSPEYTTYHFSSHARVQCVECHIGSGAEWYVRSKISGIRQIFATLGNTFPRPIPTPIHDLRPARETCEECHWPSRFIGYKEVVRQYYMGDEDNTEWAIRLLLKIGGEKSRSSVGSGIHYHMLIASKVEYIARDTKRQEIPWVRITRADGSVTEYNNYYEPLSDEERASLETRVLDCMDCHNRPAHHYPSPTDAVNAALENRLISPNLPYIKLEATKALDTEYEDTPSAMVGIANALRQYYHEEYPEILEEKPQMVTDAIAEVQNIYSTSIFPEMKADWRAYPDNISHRNWPGCFRCHNEEMESDSGDTIFTTCNRCHLILAQGEDVEEPESVNFKTGQVFYHQADEEEIDEYTECVDCHTGGADIFDE